MKTVVGTYLIDAPFSALNNKGIDKRSANENEVSTKVINSLEGIRPYVSAQALRFWWRNILESKFGWKCSPVKRVGDNQAITEADPFTYDDDDVFGYMSARKEETTELDKKGKPKTVDVTVTRVSPLKCSPLIGFPIKPTSDFGVLVRKFEGNPILFSHQFYSNILKGIFALDIDMVGRYTNVNKPGMRNLTSTLLKSYQDKGLKLNELGYQVSKDLKTKRVSETMLALKYLNGGAMQALHHTDVTPKLIVLTLLDGGNNIFMNVCPHNKYENGLVNIDSLNEVLQDYKRNILTKVYIGITSGFGTDKDQELLKYKPPEGVDVDISTPSTAIEHFVEELKTKIM